MATRRGFLAGLLASGLPLPTWADAGSPTHLAAGKLGEAYALHGLTATGDSLFSIPLPARGHAAAAHPTRPVAVAFARRPGTFGLVIDCVDGRVTHRITPPDGRQFNGHGAFSADAETLYTSEVVAETSEGRIGLWRSSDYARIGEWASGGIGPHDMKRLGDGSLIVANGGIVTDPTDRTKLNLATMRPNLTQLSPDGAVLAQVDLPELLQNSIRHLALTATGVAFAMQWEGDPADPVPLLGLWTPGQTPILCPAPDADAYAMQGYAGSIAVDAATGDIAITSPKGGIVMRFAASGAHLATWRRADVCGMAATGAGFIASDGAGALWAVEDDGLQPLARHATLWDNHIVRI
ncbi:MAG: DUF1513 domain-containing protein [Pseudomonadota bacterium]